MDRKYLTSSWINSLCNRVVISQRLLLTVVNRDYNAA